MKLVRHWPQALWLLVFPLMFTLAPPPSKADEAISPEVFRRVVDVLRHRRVAVEGDLPRQAEAGRARAGASLRDVFRQVVGTVPLIISTGGDGSGVVIEVNRAESWGLVITNHHVVDKPFRYKSGRPVVALVFYDPVLAREVLEEALITKCQEPLEKSPLCEGFRRAFRYGFVVATEPGRDLALLLVPNLPPGLPKIQAATIDGAEPDVGVIASGHPRGLLWSLTTGIVSAVRRVEPLGTIIQTQTPVTFGSSGGPLLTLEGRLIGVIRGGVAHGEGLNIAIGINEVQTFTSQHAPRGRLP